MEKNDVMKELLGTIGASTRKKCNTVVDVYFETTNKLSELKGKRNVFRSFNDGKVFFSVWYVPTTDGGLTVYVEVNDGFYCTFTNEFVEE